ncbi:MAG: glycosyltransferase family 39 protein [Candidatus Omnitrophica bacterium]|nr:glycosyltransferase family 39 protein [Candidatus Omnitrophota bacterium]
MINLLAYLMSLFIGFFVIRIILKNQPALSTMLMLCLSIGLGLGISATLTFYSLFIFEQFNQTAIFSINFVVLLGLLIANILCFPKGKNKNHSPSEQKNNMKFYITCSICWGIAIIIIAILSKQYPFGGWDAWGLYNMKAKFLIFGAERWRDFAKVHWHTQPSYPLLLPLINTWIFAVFQKGIIAAASMTSIVFSVSCGLLLYAGLSQFIRKWIAFLASLLLMSTPSYIFWSTTQYADVVLSYFLLSSVILLAITLKNKNYRFALLSGLFLGLMPFAKNEGIVMMFFLSGLTSAYLLLRKDLDRTDAMRIIRFLFIGIAITGAATLIFKIFLAPTTREVLFNPLTKKLEFCNINGFLTTIGFYKTEFLNRGWNFIWVLIVFLGILRPKNLIRNEKKIFLTFFALFFTTLLYVYLTTAHFDLTWRLECTASRIILYLLPAVVFFSFYSFWGEDSQ